MRDSGHRTILLRPAAARNAVKAWVEWRFRERFADAGRYRHIGGMAGRVKRKHGLAQAEALALARRQAAATCALCARPLGARTEWHHRVPKSEGGTEVIALHPICHRAIHAAVSNRDLATGFADLDALRARDDIARFLRWIADKPADFHAPTRRGRSG